MDDRARAGAGDFRGLEKWIWKVVDEAAGSGSEKECIGVSSLVLDIFNGFID